MLLLFTILLVFIILSRIVETSTKIPSTLTLIVLSFLLSYFSPEVLNISNDQFDEILYLMLPVILLPDILNISSNELKKHYKEIIYLAIVAVLVSISIAIFITPFLLPEHSFTIGMLIALYTMLMATDAITVSSIMSKFKLPENLKIYAESESLFNDVTALIIFYFIALPMISGGELTILDINTTLFKVLFLSTAIGVIVAYIGYFFIKVLKNFFDQFLVIYLIVIVSFMTAEHFHIAGILSIVTSVLTFKYLVKKELSKNKIHNLFENNNDIESSLMRLIKTVPALTKKGFREYKKEAEFIGIFANAIVFMIVASLIDINLLLTYTKEILIIFFITTIIRFIAIGSMIKKLSLPFRWTKALTFSGAKGALAIIMVHSLPSDFIYKEMFDAIVVGNVLLTTFIYTILLMIHINNNETEYKKDINNSATSSNTKISALNLVDLLEKDILTGAYNQNFIEDIIEKEIKRSQRYKTEFSCILIDFSFNEKNDNIYKSIGNIINDKIRTNDYFGKLTDEKFIILTSSTSLSGAMLLAEKLDKLFRKKDDIVDINNISFGITQSGDIDTYSSIMEKLEDALNRAKNAETKRRIEIET
ncbi:MAG: cation:proton antiporter [Campylobacterota bacterium]|nr:cation:proton antiporter [Campylobacterota bacterium]